MSINITVHGSSVNSGSLKNTFLSEECIKKKEFEERRKLRLEQVRQRSKEIASQVRRNVERENKRQLERIDKLKNDELLQWRKKVAAQLKNDYDKTLSDVGQAHKAAAEITAAQEYEKLQPYNVHIRRFSGLPKKALSLGKTKKVKKIVSKKHNIKTPPQVQKKHKQPKKMFIINDENSSPNIANISMKKSPKFTKLSSKARNEISVSSSLSSEESILRQGETTPEKIPHKNTCPKTKQTRDKSKKLTQTPSVIMEIDSESDSSASLNIEDSHDSSNMHYSRITSKHFSTDSSMFPKRQKERSENHEDNQRRKQFISDTLAKPTKQIHFTQISDLIKQKHQEEQEEEKQKNFVLVARESPRRCLQTLFEKDQISKDTLNTITTASKRNWISKSPPISPRKVTKITSSSSSIPSMPTHKIAGRSSIIKSTSTLGRQQMEPQQQQCQHQQQRQHNQPYRVQFYDYNNKFEKQYDPPRIIQSDTIQCGLNAMQKAEIEAEFEEHRRKEFEKAKIKSEERYQRALEREQVQREYEALTAKLNAISKDKRLENKLRSDSNDCNFVRLKSIAEQNKKKLDEKMKDILQQPIVIKYPQIGESCNEQNKKNGQRNSNLFDLNVNDYKETEGTFNSSDSSASILLNYVSDQSKQVTEDIANCDSMQKVKLLKNLLVKINNLRCELLKEIKNFESVPYSDTKIHKIVDSIETVRKERENILNLKKNQENNKEEISVDQKKRKELDKKEKELKRKEAILEKRLKDLYKANKVDADTDKLRKGTEPMESQVPQKAQTADTEDESSDILVSTEKVITEEPIEIVIKVRNQILGKRIKSPFKIHRKRANFIEAKLKKKQKDHVSQTINEEPLPTGITRKVTPHKQQQSEGGSSVTTYHSPPNEIHTPLTYALDGKAIETKNSGPCKLKENKEPPQKSTPLSKVTTTALPSKHKTQMHPTLTHYIQRLLGMSHHTVEMLGVSTSEIETPSSSIVDNSANVSVANDDDNDSFEKAKVERLKKFIQDNYKFLNEIDDSLKKDSSTSMDSSVKTIEQIWKQTLKQKQQENEKMKKQVPKPILKKTKASKKIINDDKSFASTSIPAPVVEKPKSSDIDLLISQKLLPPPQLLEQDIPCREKETPTNDVEKLKLLGKYSDLAEHCTQRIVQLNEMITKVREEKQKILEITLSSGGETARTSTEYVDFCENKSIESGKVLEKKITSPPRSPEKAQLEKNKLTGMSRDSGISLSRPVTALDSRESPEISSFQEDFVPVLKDIPKPSPSIISVAPLNLHNGVATSDMIGVSKSKKEKPPVSLERYSPQLGDELPPPHELSTIIEVDTPGTSRLNTSVADKRDHTPSENLLETANKVTENVIMYQKFPSFHEYVKENKLDLTKFDQDTISQLQSEYEEITTKIEKTEGEQKSSENIQTNINISYLIKELSNSLKQLNLSFKKFPSRKEYLDQMGISDSMDSKSIDVSRIPSETVIDKENDVKSVEDSTSVESLIDVIKELKRRKMVTNSFQYEIPEKLVENKTSEEYDLAETTTSSSNHLQNKKENLQKSPRKHTKQTKQQSDDAAILSGLEMLESSTSSQNHSEYIQNELNKMGLTWATTMLKRTQENRKEYGSSTSSSVHFDLSSQKKRSPRKSWKTEEIAKTIKQELSDITNDSVGFAGGRPLNLREFLAKELQKRTANITSSSNSSSNGSLTSHFLRSLLGSSGSRSSEKRSITKGTMKSTERLKTSTPVNTRSSTIESSNSSHSQKFFLNNSRPSSVRLSSHSSGDGEFENENKKPITSTIDPLQSQRHPLYTISSLKNDERSDEDKNNKNSRPPSPLNTNKKQSS